MGITHATVAVGTDAGTGEIHKAEWNAAHTGADFALLEQHTASSSATLDFTTFISSTYDEYVIEFINVMPATDGTTLRMRVGTGGGPTFDTGSNYYWNSYVSRLGAAAATGSASDTSASLMYTGVASNSASWGGLSGQLRLINPQSALYKRVFGHTYCYSTDGYDAQSETWATYLSTTAITALRFYEASGDIASRTIRVYGLGK